MQPKEEQIKETAKILLPFKECEAKLNWDIALNLAKQIVDAGYTKSPEIKLTPAIHNTCKICPSLKKDRCFNLDFCGLKGYFTGAKAQLAHTKQEAEQQGFRIKEDYE
jgi:hypothetical protein